MMNLNEHQRLSYLEAIGVVSYVPRFLLPRAKYSNLLESSDCTDNTTASPIDIQRCVDAPIRVAVERDLPDHVKLDAPAGGLISGILSALEPAKKNTAMSDEMPALVQAVVVDQDIARPFLLSIWRPSSALIIVDTRQSETPLPTQSLLQNMLAAKNIKEFSQAPEVLQWPSIVTSAAPGSWNDASDMVLAYLSARLHQQPAQYLWVMGETAFRALSPQHIFGEKLGQSLNINSLGVLAVVLPSLSEMVLTPKLKAIAWSAIRDLHVN
jgi:hypothetical protein